MHHICLVLLQPTTVDRRSIYAEHYLTYWLLLLRAARVTSLIIYQFGVENAQHYHDYPELT